MMMMLGIAAVRPGNKHALAVFAQVDTISVQPAPECFILKGIVLTAQLRTAARILRGIAKGFTPKKSNLVFLNVQRSVKILLQVPSSVFGKRVKSGSFILLSIRIEGAPDVIWRSDAFFYRILEQICRLLQNNPYTQI
jgi:hypothetical protein